MPAQLRPHVAAVYAFARTADDFADEPGYHASERIRLLRDWRAKLHDRDDQSNEFIALHDTIERFSLPVQLFDDLLNAFVQDVGTPRYSTWADVLEYCRQSANPVGRLVLRLSGYHDDRLDAASDAVCTALQLTNFWQDLQRDYQRGRLYLPRDEQVAHGAREEDLAAGRITSSWQSALAAAALRTRVLFNAGRPLCDAFRGRMRYELRATWLGGTRILDRLIAARFDLANRRPTLALQDAPWFAWKLLAWPSAGAGGA
jgi:phytoene synthase